MMNTMVLFKTSAIVELLTGLALLVAPLFVIGMLLSDGLGSTGVAVTRVLGIGLFSVGVAAWELPGQDTHLTTRAGLCIYNVGVSIVLVILGTYSEMNGILLWPVTGLHALIGTMMLWVILAPSQKAAGE